MKKSYVYKITCKITGEFYFGSSFNAKRDYYWGSGRKIKEQIAQYGKENFVKEILGEFDDRVEAHKVENQYIEQFRHNEKCLNKKLEHHFDSFSEETLEKRSAVNRGDKNPMFGKHFYDDTRAKMSVAHRGKIFSEEHKAKLSAANRGENHHNFGKHLSDDTRAKLSAALRGKPHPHGKHWRKNPITGKREYYD